MPRLPSALSDLPAGAGQGVEFGRSDLCQGIPIDVADGFVPARDLQHAFLLVRPGPVVVYRHADPVAKRTEGPVEEWVGQDAVDLGTDGRRKREVGGFGLGRA